MQWNQNTIQRLEQSILDGGDVDLASTLETIAGTSTLKAVTPAGLLAALPAYPIAPSGGDDAAAIQARIDALVAVSPGVPAIAVDLLPGVYDFQTTLNLYQRAFIIRGHGIGNPTDYIAAPGKGTTIRWGGAAGIPMINVRDVWQFVIQDVYIAGNDTNVPSEAIYFQNAGGTSGANSWMLVDRVRFGYSGWPPTGGQQIAIDVRFGGTNGNNDQFTFRNCVFNKPSTACVQIDNTQSIWGAFYDCTFDGHAGAAKGLVTSANTTLFNPQFNGCLKDIEVNSSAYVTVYSWQSEESRLFADLTTSSSKLYVRGGFARMDEIVGGYCITANAMTSGILDLDGFRLNTGTASPRPQISAIGGATAGTGATVAIRNCLTTSADYAFSSTGGSTGKLNIIIQDAGVIDFSRITGTTTFVPITAGSRFSPALLPAPRIDSVASASTPSINTDTTDLFKVTAQAATITSFTTNLTGTPTDGQRLSIAITDNGTARGITWGASFEASGVALPITTNAGIRLDVEFIWNTVTSKWRCIRASVPTTRVVSATSLSNPAINTDATDQYELTAQAAAVTSFTTNLTGTPVAGQRLSIAVTDNGTARAIGWGASFEAAGAPLPSTTVASVRLEADFKWNPVTSKWGCIRTSVPTPRVGTVASSATPTINTDNFDLYRVTALAVAVTSFTTNLTGTPVDGQRLIISITDNGTARAITWGAKFEASTVALPTTTVISTRLDVEFVWNTVTAAWRCQRVS
jgi:hypothetical protein